MIISKSYKWDMAHRLYYQKGICHNLHGHSYRANIVIEGETNEEGMIIDFCKLDQYMDIISKLDHSMIICSKDKSLIDFAKTYNMRHFIIDGDTTVENITILLKDIIKNNFRRHNNIHNAVIRVYETSKCYSQIKIANK